MARKDELLITVSANLEKAKSDVLKFSKQLDDLDEVDVEIRAKLDEAEADVERFGKQLDELESVDVTVTANVEGQAALTDVSTEVDELDGRKATVTVDTDVADVKQPLSDVRTELDGVRDSGDQSRSVLANMAGNTAQDLGEVGGIVGTLGVGIGQLAEYATEGNIKLSELAGVAAPMAGLAAAGLAVNHIMGQIAESKAFHAENVKAFTKAIEDGADAAQALRDRLREAGEIKIDLGGPFGGTADVSDLLDSLGISLEEFSTVVTGNRDELHKWTGALYEAEGFNLSTQQAVRAATQYWEDNQKAVEKAADAIDSITETDVAAWLDDIGRNADPIGAMPDVWDRMARAINDGATPAVEDVTAAMETFGLSGPEVLDKASEHAEDMQSRYEGVAEGISAALDEVNQAFEDAEEAQQKFFDAQRAAADSTFAVQQAADDLIGSIQGYSQAVTDAYGDTAKLHDVQQDARDSATSYADAVVRQAQDQAAANGTTLSAADAQRTWRGAMVEAAAYMSGEQRDVILDYIGRVESIPPEKLTEIEALLDEGKIDEAERVINDTARDRDTTIVVDANTVRANDKIASLERRLAALNRNTGGGSSGSNQTPGSQEAAAFIAPAAPEEPEAFAASSFLTAAPATSSEPTRVPSATTFAGNTTTNIYYPPSLTPRQVGRAQRRWQQRGGR